MRPLCLSVLLVLSGCVSAPASAPHAAPPVLPTGFAAPAANVPAETAGSAAWWQAWGDPALDALVTRALAANPDVRQALARVRAARAMTAVAESALWPTVAAQGAGWVSDGSGSIGGSLGSLLAMTPGGTTGARGGGHALSLGAAWEPDVFGGHHADRDAARTLALAADDIVAGTRLMVAADVVENYQQAAGLAQRLALLDRATVEAARLVDYARGRMEAGSATGADVARAQEKLEALNAGRASLVELITIRERRLAVLAGDLPEHAAALSDHPALAPPDAPGGELPSAVLDRRPDVRVSARLVAARAARLKSLKTDLLPHFVINFVGEDGRIALAGLPGYGQTNGFAGVGVSIPVFTAGRLKARVAMGDADLEAAMAAHDRAVLTALEEVEAAYGLRHGLDRKLVGDGAALARAKARASADEALYASGRITLGDVLQARLDAIADADTAEQTRIARGSATVQLFRALGGAWSVSPATPAPLRLPAG